MTALKDSQLPEDKQPNFLLTINFAAGVKNPQRVFSAASDYISALQACDHMLLRSFPGSIQPVFVLEEVQNGSLKVWLRQALEAVDDDALKNLDWKPAVGKYLVKGKHLLLKRLEGKTGLPPKKELQEISDELHRLAKDTDALRLPAYTRVTEVEIAEHARILSSSLSHLLPGESVSMTGDDGESTMMADFIVTDEEISRLLIDQTLENTSDVILMVRKPDFLGETKWEFRFNRRNLSVSIVDKDWLSSFQSGDIDIRPGDALRVRMKERVLYDIHGEVVSEEREIIDVVGVIRKQEHPSQVSLLE